MGECLHSKRIFVKLPEAKEKQEYMLMLSEGSEESATFFLHNNFNALEQREGFYSIHIQSCLKALCDGCHNQISAQKRNSCSHHCINCSEESEKLLWNPAHSAETPTDTEKPWFPSEYVMKRSRPTDPHALVSLRHSPALRGHHHLGAASLGLLLWISLSSSSSPVISEDASGNLLAKTPFLSYMSDRGWWEKPPHLKLKK